jgi:hypothetical protein
VIKREQILPTNARVEPLNERANRFFESMNEGRIQSIDRLEALVSLERIRPQPGR